MEGTSDRRLVFLQIAISLHFQNKIHIYFTFHHHNEFIVCDYEQKMNNKENRIFSAVQERFQRNKGKKNRFWPKLLIVVAAISSYADTAQARIPQYQAEYVLPALLSLAGITSDPIKEELVDIIIWLIYTAEGRGALAGYMRGRDFDGLHFVKNALGFVDGRCHPKIERMLTIIGNTPPTELDRKKLKMLFPSDPGTLSALAAGSYGLNTLPLVPESDRTYAAILIGLRPIIINLINGIADLNESQYYLLMRIILIAHVLETRDTLGDVLKIINSSKEILEEYPGLHLLNQFQHDIDALSQLSTQERKAFLEKACTLQNITEEINKVPECLHDNSPQYRWLQTLGSVKISKVREIINIALTDSEMQVLFKNNTDKFKSFKSKFREHINSKIDARNWKPGHFSAAENIAIKSFECNSNVLGPFNTLSELWDAIMEVDEHNRQALIQFSRQVTSPVVCAAIKWLPSSSFLSNVPEATIALTSLSLIDQSKLLPEHPVSFGIYCDSNKQLAPDCVEMTLLHLLELMGVGLGTADETIQKTVLDFVQKLHNSTKQGLTFPMSRVDLNLHQEWHEILEKLLLGKKTAEIPASAEGLLELIKAIGCIPHEIDTGKPPQEKIKTFISSYGIRFQGKPITVTINDIDPSHPRPNDNQHWPQKIITIDTSTIKIEIGTGTEHEYEHMEILKIQQKST
jgi:hypothetical protein